jgi:hypothetical protein
MTLFVEAAASYACALDGIRSGLFLKSVMGMLSIVSESLFGCLSAIVIVCQIKVWLVFECLKLIAVLVNLVLNLQSHVFFFTKVIFCIIKLLPSLLH